MLAFSGVLARKGLGRVLTLFCYQVVPWDYEIDTVRQTFVASGGHQELDEGNYSTMSAEPTRIQYSMCFCLNSRASLYETLDWKASLLRLFYQYSYQLQQFTTQQGSSKASTSANSTYLSGVQQRVVGRQSLRMTLVLPDRGGCLCCEHQDSLLCELGSIQPHSVILVSVCLGAGGILKSHNSCPHGPKFMTHRPP